MTPGFIFESVHQFRQRRKKEDILLFSGFTDNVSDLVRDTKPFAIFFSGGEYLVASGGDDNCLCVHSVTLSTTGASSSYTVRHSTAHSTQITGNNTALSRHNVVSIDSYSKSKRAAICIEKNVAHSECCSFPCACTSHFLKV